MGHAVLVVEARPRCRRPGGSRSTACAIADCMRMPRTSSLSSPSVLDVVLVELAHREAEPARLDRGAVEQRGVGEQDAARVQRDVAGQPVEATRRGRRTCRAAPSACVRPGRWPAARAGRAARRGRRAPGCAGTPWRSRRSRRAAGRARHRRRGSRGGRDRCPSSTRTRTARRRSARGSARRPRYVERTRRRCRRRAAPDAQRGEEALHQQAVAHRVDPGDPEQV